MKQVDIQEVQTRLAELLAEVESGQSIVITHEGVPKGMLSQYLGEAQDSTFGQYGKYVGKISTGNDGADDEANFLF